MEAIIGETAVVTCTESERIRYCTRVCVCVFMYAHVRASVCMNRMKSDFT